MRKRSTTLLLPLALLAAASVPAAASAQSCKAPPGMSAIDQYCEAIPAPGGDRGSTDGDRGGLPIAPAVARRLLRDGREGAAIIALSAAAHKGQVHGHTRLPRSGAGALGAPLEHGSSNPIVAIGAGLRNSSVVVGPGFGSVLLALALIFLGASWFRYRRRAPD